MCGELSTLFLFIHLYLSSFTSFTMVLMAYYMYSDVCTIVIINVYKQRPLQSTVSIVVSLDFAFNLTSIKQPRCEILHFIIWLGR